jgi:hypothetical protein
MKKIIIAVIIVILIIVIIVNTNMFKYWAMDKVTRSKLNLLHSKKRGSFIAFVDECQAKGWYIIITRSYSSFAKQTSLQSVNTLAVDAGYSAHNYGMAIDCNFYNGKIELTSHKTKEEWESSGIIDIAKKHGLRWGGYFTPYDPVHFDCTTGSAEIKKYREIAIKQFGNDLDKIEGNKINI